MFNFGNTKLNKNSQINCLALIKGHFISMKKIILLLLTSLAFNSFSQKYVDLATLNYSYGKHTSYCIGDILLPLQIDSNNTFLVNLGVRSFSFNTIPDVTYNEFKLVLGLKHQFNKKWTGTFMFVPRHKSRNGNSASLAPSYQFGGIAVMKKKKSEHLSYKLGAYGNQDLFGTFLVPILGIDWKINTHFEVKALLPLKARIYYHLNEKNSLMLFFRGIIGSYYQNEKPLNIDCVNNDCSKNSYLHETYTELSLKYEIEPIKNIVIQPKIGLTIGSNYQTYQEGDRMKLGISAFKFNDKRTPLSEIDNSGWIAGISLIYRFHLEE